MPALLESAVVGLYSWLFSLAGKGQHIPGAAEVMKLIGEGEPGTEETERVPFVGLSKYVRVAHVRVMGVIAANRWEKAAGLA
ncbi:hypothetical protein V8F33_008980 [Rhypophila sp. PSN 637]